MNLHIPYLHTYLLSSRVVAAINSTDGKGAQDFNIAIKNQNLKQAVNLSIWEEASVQRREPFQTWRGG